VPDEPVHFFSDKIVEALEGQLRCMLRHLRF
jgi:hypothetical protein